MQIKVTDLGKRYHYEWIFRHLNYQFEANKSYAILGHNGSGKSTLVNIISGYLSPNEGSIQYKFQGQEIAPDNLFRYLAYTAPYLELIEEFTLLELIQYHSRFKKLLVKNPDNLIQKLYLEKAKHKFVKDFSSGMKQRLKLGLAIYTDAPLLLLDEPTTNLDQEGVNWYLDNVQQNRKDRLVLVSSNIPQEYSFCEETIRITDYHSVPK